jgi:transcriptional regulator with XRE-family HTH domain
MKPYKDIIRGLREDRDLKQSEIANVLGTTQQHYSKYETGEYELPVRALVLLADYYGVSTEYLLGRPYLKDDLTVLGRKVDEEQTAGDVLDDIMSLNPKARASVLEYISLHKLKESCSCSKKQ